MSRGRCAVIGAGVAGLATALALAERGAEVTLVERLHPGAGASNAAGGLLCPLYPWRQPAPVQALFARSRALRAARPADGVADSALLCLDRLDEDETRAVAAWAERHRLHVETPAALARGAGPAGFALRPVGLLDPPRWIAARARDAERRGARLVRARVDGLLLEPDNRPDDSPDERPDGNSSDKPGGRPGNKRVAGLRLEHGRLAAERVIVCAGAWSDALLPAPLGVRPVRGQMIAFDAAPGLLEQVALQGGRYLIPRPDGRVLAGSTVEDCGFDAAVSAAARRALTRFARDLLPALDAEPAQHWAGLRPGGRDTPFIGPWPGVAGLFVNTCHFRNGFALAPASAELAAQLALGERPALDPRPYRVVLPARPGGGAL